GREGWIRGGGPRARRRVGAIEAPLERALGRARSPAAGGEWIPSPGRAPPAPGGDASRGEPYRIPPRGRGGGGAVRDAELGGSHRARSAAPPCSAHAPGNGAARRAPGRRGRAARGGCDSQRRQGRASCRDRIAAAADALRRGRGRGREISRRVPRPGPVARTGASRRGSAREVRRGRVRMDHGKGRAALAARSSPGPAGARHPHRAQAAGSGRGRPSPAPGGRGRGATEMKRTVKKETDVLVIGSGVAGLSAALHAARFARVLVVTKREGHESNTNYAQGGIAAPLGEDDRPDLHERDTPICGAGLSDPESVRVVVEAASGEIEHLVSLGVRFDRDPKTPGALALGQEGGHSRRRIVHAKDRTGRAVESTLLDQVRKHPKISILENHIMVDLILESKHLAGRKRAP